MCHACHDQRHDSAHDHVLRLPVLHVCALRLRGLQRDGGARRRRALRLWQRVRLRRLRLPAELRLRCVAGDDMPTC